MLFHDVLLPTIHIHIYIIDEDGEMVKFQYYVELRTFCMKIYKKSTNQ